MKCKYIVNIKNPYLGYFVYYSFSNIHLIKYNFKEIINNNHNHHISHCPYIDSHYNIHKKYILKYDVNLDNNIKYITNGFNIYSISTTIIGHGSYGQIYLGINIYNNQFVAIKIIRKSYLFSVHEKIMPFIEYWNCTKVKHSNIPTIHDFFEDSNNYYIIMDYVNGKTLCELISFNRLKKNHIIKIMKALCYILQTIHNYDILHRDINTSNIIITKDFDVYIIDFGLSCFMQKKKLFYGKYIIGTSNFMSPEIKEKYIFSKYSDIWALGIVFFSMICGYTPLSKYLMEDLQNHFNNNNDKINKIINKMLIVNNYEKRISLKNIIQILSNYHV